jgi:hypothetical protein
MQLNVDERTIAVTHSVCGAAVNLPFAQTGGVQARPSRCDHRTSEWVDVEGGAEREWA